MSRLDKFLWSVRLYKTRADAADACKSGKVKVNGIEAKSSREVKPGDIIDVRKAHIVFKFNVIAPIDKRQPAKLTDQFIINITPQEELDKLAIPKESLFLHRDRGTGRPTKKDRRDMDGLMEIIGMDEEYD
ncbi:MAG: RNA-binding S4 domain-containing protein [Bacteroidales bacterium]|jgi:ribosome-associated heat shock protein Hsp15|nr:RNA-binding S4 domain-containing protein [Bacteroidales bacterium]MDZ4059477.1 RNA-binding S4 domain-containing protein [Bacteroidales bacterium]